MNGHTPGPWDCYADKPSTDPNWHIVTSEGRQRVIANVYIEPGNAMDEANARLITAAPELLAALDSVCDTGRLLLDYMDGPRNPENQERNLADAISAARAVIAKAKGGA